MSKLSIKTEIDLNALLAGAANLKIKELEAFVRELNGIITRKKTEDKSYREAKLLRLHMETILDTNDRKRLIELSQKLETESISTAEHDELMRLSKTEAQLRNERVKILIELAQLKNISLPKLMEELQLTPVGHG